MFLMFQLERPDVLAVGDLGIRRAVERAYGLDELPDAGRARRARRAVAPAPQRGVPAAVEVARPDPRRVIGRRRRLRLGGLEPVSRTFGFERGKPIDRWYIERFLAAHAGDVRGRVLEVAEPTYTQWYGGGEVTSSDVLHRTGEGCPGPRWSAT